MAFILLKFSRNTTIHTEFIVAFTLQKCLPEDACIVIFLIYLLISVIMTMTAVYKVYDYHCLGVNLGQ